MRYQRRKDVVESAGGGPVDDSRAATSNEESNSHTDRNVDGGAGTLPGVEGVGASVNLSADDTAAATSGGGNGETSESRHALGSRYCHFRLNLFLLY
jgi:hypothetical protein